LITLAAAILFYYNYLLFQEYISIILWALLLSTALRSVKDSIVQEIRNQHAQSRQHSITSVFRVVVTQLFGKSFWELIFQALFLGTTALTTASILAQLFGWNMLISAVFFIILLLLVIYLVDGYILRLFRLLMDDEHTLVTLLLMSMLFTLLCFLGLFFGFHCLAEAVSAANTISQWIETEWRNNEEARKSWGIHSDNFVLEKQLEAGKAMAQTLASQLVEYINGTKWSPLLQAALDVFHNSTESGNTVLPLDRFYSVLTRPNASFELYHSLKHVTSDTLSIVSQPMFFLTRLSGFIVTLLLGASSFLAFGVAYLLDVVFRVFLFFMVLFFSLRSQQDMVQGVANSLLPVQSDQSKDVIELITRSIQGESS